MASGTAKIKQTHRIPGLGVTIHFYRPKPTGNWRFRVRRKGHPPIHRSTGYSDYEKALVVATNHVTTTFEGADTSDLSMEQLLDNWLETGGIRNEMAQSTKKANRSGIGNILRWLHREGITRLSQINYEVGTRYKGWLDSHYASKKTRNFHLGILKAATRWAVEGPGYISKDPLRKVHLLKLKQRDRVGTRSYTDKELADILKEVEHLPLPLYLGVLLAYYVGGRRSDICNLRVGDIELAGDQLYLNIIESKSKNARRQLIGSPHIRNLILQCAKDRSAEDYLLSWPTPNGGMHPDILGRRLSAIVRNLGITDIRFPFHTLRHTFATKLAIEKGVPLPTVMKLTGHRDMATLLGYVHSEQADADEAITKL